MLSTKRDSVVQRLLTSEMNSFIIYCSWSFGVKGSQTISRILGKALQVEEICMLNFLNTTRQ